MTAVTADQAIARARLLRPDMFRVLNVDMNLTADEYRAEEVGLAFSVLYGTPWRGQ